MLVDRTGMQLKHIIAHTLTLSSLAKVMKRMYLGKPACYLARVQHGGRVSLLPKAFLLSIQTYTVQFCETPRTDISNARSLHTCQARTRTQQVLAPSISAH